MAKTRKRYTEQERARILGAAKREGLTGKQAAKKFGVSEVTLWKWRRDAKGTRRPSQSRALRPGKVANDSLDRLLRDQVRDRIHELLPGIVKDEVAIYVKQALGSKG